MNWKDYILEAEQVLGETPDDMLEEKMVKKYHIEHGQKKVTIINNNKVLIFLNPKKDGKGKKRNKKQ